MKHRRCAVQDLLGAGDSTPKCSVRHDLPSLTTLIEQSRKSCILKDVTDDVLNDLVNMCLVSYSRVSCKPAKVAAMGLSLDTSSPFQYVYSCTRTRDLADMLDQLAGQARDRTGRLILMHAGAFLSRNRMRTCMPPCIEFVLIRNLGRWAWQSITHDAEFILGELMQIQTVVAPLMSLVRTSITFLPKTQLCNQD